MPPSAVLGIAFTDEERVVAWGTVGQSPVAWEAPSGKALSPVPMHAGPIRSIAFAAGGKEIVTAGSEGRIVRWDAATGRTVGEYQLRGPRGGFGMPGSLRNIAGLSPDGTQVMTPGPPGAIYDLATGIGNPRGAGRAEHRRLHDDGPLPRSQDRVLLDQHVRPGEDGHVRGVGPRGSEEAGGGGDPAEQHGGGGRGVVAVGRTARRGGVFNRDWRNPTPAMVITGWELKSGKKLGTVEDVKMTGQIQIAAASESTAIIATTQGKARLIDYETGKFGDEIETPQNSSYAPTPIVFSPDRKRFAMGVGLEEPGAFGVRIHEWPSARPLHTFKGHAGMVSALRFSADGKLLASGSYDGTVLVWDMAAAKVKD